MCQEWSNTYGVRTGVFRMSCIYGPNQFGFEEQGWATWFIIAAMKGKPITIYGDGDQVRDMLYVEDCVEAYDRFLRSDLKHGVFNLGGGVHNTLSINEHLNFLLVELKGTEISIGYEDWRPLDQKCYVSDIRRAEQLLGWKPKTDPYYGLRQVIKWVRENLDLF
jgi:CDP-paratose 2-epimerase